MKKDKEKELRKRINDTLKTFPIKELKESLQKTSTASIYELPPLVVEAFRNLNAIGLKRDGSIIGSLAFVDILTKYKTHKEIKSAIIKESTINRRVINYFSNMGRGGRRGKSREWLDYIKTWMLLYHPRGFLKQCKSNIEDEIKFYDLIRDAHRKAHTWDNTDIAVKIALYAMYKTLNKFYNIYDENNSTHIGALSIIFGDNFKFYNDYPHSSNSLVLKGKKVTKKSIMEQVEKVLAYTANKYKGTITPSMKFYFLAYLSEKIYRLLDMHKETRVEDSFRQIISILKPLSKEERYMVLSRLFPPDSSPQ